MKNHLIRILAIALPLTFATGCATTKPSSAAKLVQINGDRIELGETLYFETGKATLDPRSNDLLDAVADLITSKTSIGRVRIEGHTDNVGDAAANKQLSTERARAVKDYLRGKGIDGARLDAEGFGQEKPVASNDTEDGRAKNRRVDFLIVP